MDEELAALLRELVAIPSMNPYRAPTLREGYGEARLAERVAAFLADAGLEAEVRDVLPGRPNVLAWLDGPAGGDPLLFVAHLDTVPVEGMTVPPFEGLVKGGCLYGRGACDTKGSLAATLAALRRVAAAKANRVPLLFAATADEESTYAGAWALVGGGLKARAAVIGEPTRLGIVVAHKGALRIVVTTEGTSAHSSTPERGDNAIYKMTPVLRDLEALAADLCQRPPHPLVGPPTLSVGTIHGGLTINTVPDRCVVEVDRRVLPGEDTAAAEAEVRAVCERHGAAFELVFATEGFEVPLASEIVALAKAAVAAVCGRAETIGVPYGTEASAIAPAGIPTIVLGPGDAAQAHSADEWVELAQVEAAARIYERLMTAA